MIEELIKLIILFIVIFDPLVSLSVFFVATQYMTQKQRNRVAALALVVAGVISFLVLILGQQLLNLFNTTMGDFKVAGGIIIGLLGIKMALGQSLTNAHEIKNNSGVAIAAIIGTPLLTGPAAITTIIISNNDYGITLTALAIAIVLALTGIFLFNSNKVYHFLGKTSIQVISTVLGLITISWGVKFIRQGIGI